ncbi:peroxidase 57-like [Silene latifolia]|uniref:peroxidase 57-like n=1 Tax=Silene latifolia TaxID=37657 RepID=UPI003D77488C
MVRASSSTSILALGFLLMTLVANCYGELRLNYYTSKCGKVNVEEAVFYIVKEHYIEEKDTVADLVRLQFHDCFVRGCDASILLQGRTAELASAKDATIAGLDVVEEIKVTLDKYCPGVVSCADIIVLAARSAVYLGGAKWYDVETGRKDGRISSASEAQNALPGPNIPVGSAIKLFAQYGLNTEDFVVLLGCHTVGTAHCPSFEDRLYYYNGANGRSDPTINPTFLSLLKKTCPRGSNNQAFLDQTKGSEFVMDNGFFKRILEGKGTLKIDQAMAYDPQTTKIVQSLAYNPTLFGAKIGPAMRKMAKIGVILNGEVRLGTCTKVR